MHPEELVRIGEKPKTVMSDGVAVLLVSAIQLDDCDASWQTMHRKQLRGY